MAKSFLCRRSPAAMAVMTDVIDHVRKDLQRAAKQHGTAAIEIAELISILGFLYYLVEDYGKAEPLMQRYVAIIKEKSGYNTRETLEGLGLLFEIYVALNRIDDIVRIGNEANALSRKLAGPFRVPLVEALFRRAKSHEGANKTESREQGLAFALMCLCWCMTRGFDAVPAGMKVLVSLQSFFTSYGIEDEWAWVVKHARLNKYDFVGLLSILLHHTGLTASPSVPWAKRRVRVIEVR